MKDVIAYCRVACAKQSDPSAEVQLQEQMIRRYADARRLIICATYLDAGVSGEDLNPQDGAPRPDNAFLSIGYRPRSSELSRSDLVHRPIPDLSLPGRDVSC